MSCPPPPLPGLPQESSGPWLHFQPDQLALFLFVNILGKGWGSLIGFRARRIHGRMRMSPLKAEGGRDVVRCHTSPAGRLPELSYQPGSLPLEKQWIALWKNNCSMHLGHLFQAFYLEIIRDSQKLQKWYIGVLRAHYLGSPNGDVCALSRPEVHGHNMIMPQIVLDFTFFFLHALIFLLVSVHRSLTPLFF